MVRTWLITASAIVALAGCTRDLATSETQLRIARQSFNATSLTSSLEAIAQWHEAHETGLADQLAPALPENEISERLADIDCNPTAEMLALWSWHNGGSGNTPMVWYHDFLSVDEAIMQYRLLTLNPMAPWDPRYLPLFYFEGEWYAAYCGEEGLQASRVLPYFQEDALRVTNRTHTSFLN